ncbi:type VI secretion system protein TssA [Mangrovitalea sediminis]|uniref:type VI secretion system protein TssA n=1 Tax=Mangrovitalea sediminis TaxID=1982043 RepID=UPI0013045D1F|nr:type VI secretion system protein TssA [Mangrovitalea sediminis]
MAPQDVFDIDGLLTAIEGETGTGVDLRESGDSDYARVKDARRRVVSLARQGRLDPTLDAEISQAWALIGDLAPQILQTRAKDLEVAAWLTEALLRRDGIPGLENGFRLIEQLVERFWDHLHPMPDEDGMETRLYPLIGLNGEDGNGSLVTPIRNAPLSDDPDHPITANLLQRCRDAAAIDDPDSRRQRFDEIGMDMDALQQQVARCDMDFCQNLLAATEASQETLKRLSDALDERVGAAEAPPVSALRASLEVVADALRQLYGSRLDTAASQEQAAAEQPEATPVATATAANTAGGSSMPSVVSGPIQSRQDALQQLQAIADFFRQQEPHSPIAGAIERVGRWARLPLNQLLQELIPDERARSHYTLVTGVDIGADGGSPTRDFAAPSAPAPVAPAAEPSSPDSGGQDFSW